MTSPPRAWYICENEHRHLYRDGYPKIEYIEVKNDWYTWIWKYKSELEQAVRDYTKAENDIRQIKEAAINRIREVGTESLETKQILDKMIDKKNNCDDIMSWSQDQFNKTKDKMITMISNIKMPRSY